MSREDLKAFIEEIFGEMEIEKERDETSRFIDYLRGKVFGMVVIACKTGIITFEEFELYRQRIFQK